MAFDQLKTLLIGSCMYGMTEKHSSHECRATSIEDCKLSFVAFIIFVFQVSTHTQGAVPADIFISSLISFLPGYERNFFRFGRKWIDSRDVPYDYGSIMHYNKAFFSRFPVMLDTLLPLREVEIGQRKALSRFDILQANLLYKCDGEYDCHLTKALNTLNLDV